MLVKVSAAGINPLDMMVRDGEFKRLLKYPTPFVLGHDVAGVVMRAGSAVRDYVALVLLRSHDRSHAVVPDETGSLGLACPRRRGSAKVRLA